MFPDRRNPIAFLMFRYTFRPLATALMIVAKSSSARIMAAASLDTSVPDRPMAIPISAFFKAGASLTPSPVMATISPFFCQAFTMRILSAGVTRANTAYLRMSRLSSSSLNWESWVPVMASLPPSMIPSFFAMAEAVVTWSPVIITVLIPAL